MTPPKDSAERQREYRARKAAQSKAARSAGLRLLSEWVHPDDEEAIRAYAARLAKKRLRAEAKGKP